MQSNEVGQGAQQRVKAKWPHAYCLKDGEMYYIFGNPKRGSFGERIKGAKKFIGNDMLSYGETPKEAWQGVEL